MELLKVENIERFQDVSIMVRQLKPSRKQDMNNYMIAVNLELYLHVILVWIKKKPSYSFCLGLIDYLSK